MKQEPHDQSSDVTVIPCKREESYGTSNFLLLQSALLT